MDSLLYFLALGLVKFLQALPLRVVARIGRVGGAIGYFIDGRHRRVALKNLTMCFGKEKSATELCDIARENFRRLGENYACAIKTATMTWPELKPHCEFVGEKNLLPEPTMNPESVVVAIGHFGNFELYARFGQFLPAFKCATTYRGLRQPGLNRLMQSLRERSGCLYFERRKDGDALKAAMHQRGLVLGLLADQAAGNSGLRLPFLGHDCSTSAAPAIFALRYRCRLHSAICYRVGLAQWRVEAGPEIPTRDANGKPRATEDITRDMNLTLEAAVRRDPANWFWVHNRWKPTSRPVIAAKPASADESTTTASSH